MAGDGLKTVLRTDDFGRWEAALAANLGHHRSERLSSREPFQARFRVAQLGDCGILHIQGHGRLRLIREQCRWSVLWIPLRGMTLERVNGADWLAEPGSGLLLHPGDVLQGETSEELEGLSILIPAALHARPEGRWAPLLAAGPVEQRLLRSARRLGAAAAHRPPGAEHALEPFLDALGAWRTRIGGPAPRERITARRRRETVALARRWMAARLPQRFSVVELSGALEVSVRQLQYSFQEELGRSPMAEAKRLRLQRLRALLLDPDQDRRGVAELMAASGLIASGVTSGEYRAWCGESPRATRARR